MRHIKFKAWDGHTVSQNAKTIQEIANGGVNSRDPEKLIWLEFTGLLDKNGQEIYEGYILESKSWGANTRQKHKYHVVEWGKCGWVARGYNGETKVSPSLDVKTDFEVIGNIYENRYLLK